MLALDMVREKLALFLVPALNVFIYTFILIALKLPTQKIH